MMISPLIITVLTYAVIIGVAWGVLQMRVRNMGKRVDNLEELQMRCQANSEKRDESFLLRMETMIDSKLNEFMTKLLEEGRIPTKAEAKRYRDENK